ncbi:MAG: HesA/MoeB/ThiF family protein, partial [Deltaproteobacteria bacterium]|nr:HesA/MoeB/ThiF family protein [Deltaproteobacteria bacterium]
MGKTLAHRLDTLAVDASLADGTPCRTIDAGEVIRLADESGVTGRMVELAALRQHILPDRYLRNRKTLSESDQIRLLESTVCIVGLGGLGGMVTETLARMGIGRFRLVDGDVFETHNLNRQLLSSTDRIGMPKADAAVMRLKTINPGLEAVATAAYLTPENADNVVGSCDLVVDCLDNIRSRFTLEAAARRAGIPMVSAAVAGISGHVTTIFPGDQGLENIYGPKDQTKLTKGAETQLGCLAPGVNLIASLECAEVLKVLLE